MKKKIIFLTGTRADFGKLSSLIDICNWKAYTKKILIYL